MTIHFKKENPPRSGLYWMFLLERVGVQGGYWDSSVLGVKVDSGVTYIYIYIYICWRVISLSTFWPPESYLFGPLKGY